MVDCSPRAPWFSANAASTSGFYSPDLLMSRSTEDDVMKASSPANATREHINGGNVHVSSPIYTASDLAPTVCQGSQTIHHKRDEEQYGSNQNGEHASLWDLRNLDEVAAPSPVQDRGEGAFQRHDYLEDIRTQSRTRGQSPYADWSSLGSVNTPQDHAHIPVERMMSGALDVEESHQDPRASKLLMEFYTICYLVFFSFLGTLSRLVLEALTFYPGAPATTSVLWANFAGSLVLGFLSENYALFRSDAGQGTSRSVESEVSWKAREAAHKKTIPLYIWLTTGFCGCLTSFSTFLRDAFLAIANDIPSPIDGSSRISLYQLPSAAEQAPNGGYNFMAFVAIILLEVGLSVVALHIGGHISIFAARWMPILSPRLTKKIIDPFIAIAAPAIWLAIICLVIWLPYYGREDTIWSKQTWRGPALYALILSPVGCVVRFYLSLRLNGRIPSFPLGTFVANVGGTMIFGMAFTLQHAAFSPLSPGLGGGGYVGCEVLQGVMDGFCGSLTTVSTWVLELSASKRGHAYVYGFASIAISLAALVVEIGSLKWTKGFTTPACFQAV